jgi:hypothetical protein
MTVGGVVPRWQDSTVTDRRYKPVIDRRDKLEAPAIATVLRSSR